MNYLIPQRRQRFEQALIIARVQTNRWLSPVRKARLASLSRVAQPDEFAVIHRHSKFLPNARA
jgi:hypothetical protein